MDPFDTLGIEATFNLDLAALSTRSADLNRAVHPDKFVGRPRGERRMALGRAIEVNEACRMLKNPLTRGEALLARLDLALPEGSEPSISPELLMEMMEKREDLRKARRESNVERTEALASEIRQGTESLSAELASSFEQALTSARGSAVEAGVREEVAQTIHQQLATLRFYRRFLDEADATLDEIL